MPFIASENEASPVQGFTASADEASPVDQKSFSGFMNNAVSDVGDIASGVGNLAKGLVTHPINTVTGLAKNIIPATYNEYKTAITHPIEHTYQHPVNTLMDALPLAGGAMKLGKYAGLLSDAAEEAGATGAASEAANVVSPAGEVPEVSKLAEAVPEAIPETANVADAGEAAVSQTRPPVGSIVGGSDVPIAKDFVPSEERVANSMFLQGVGVTPRKFMREVSNNRTPMDVASKLRTWADTADNGKSITGLMDKPGEFLDKVQDIHNTAGKTIGGILEKAGDENPLGETLGLPAVDKQAVIDELKTFATETADPQTEGRINKLISTANKLEGKPVTDLRTLQQIKQMAGEQIHKDPEMAKVYGHLADRMDQVIDAYGKAVNDPAMKAAYAKAKVDYSNSSKLLPMLQYAESKNLIGGPAGHQTLRGMLGNMTDKISELATGTTPSQVYKNALLKGSKNVAPVHSVVSKAPEALKGTGYAGLADFLTNKYGNTGAK
jgi:hypothetical protein